MNINPKDWSEILAGIRAELDWLPETLTREETIELVTQYSSVVAAIVAGASFSMCMSMVQEETTAAASSLDAGEILDTLREAVTASVAEIPAEIERVNAEHKAWIEERKAALTRAKEL